jgi:hypothetical protein
MARAFLASPQQDIYLRNRMKRQAYLDNAGLRLSRGSLLCVGYGAPYPLPRPAHGRLNARVSRPANGIEQSDDPSKPRP